MIFYIYRNSSLTIRLSYFVFRRMRQSDTRSVGLPWLGRPCMEQHCVPSHQQCTQHLNDRSLPQAAIHHQSTHASAATPASQGIRVHHRSETLQLPRQLQPECSFCGGRPPDHVSIGVYSGSTVAEAVSLAAIEFVFCCLC